MNTLIRLLHWLYWLAVRLYPRSFHARFGAEMSEIYRCGLDDAARRGTLRLIGFATREGVDLLRSLLVEHWIVLRADASAPGRYAAFAQGPSSWGQAWTGASLFLVSGGALVVHALLADQIGLFWRLGSQAVLLLGLVVFPTAGCALGWIKGFPRWSYPFVLLTAMVNFSLMNQALLGGELSLGGWHGQVAWLLWLPLLGLTALALLISRSAQPAIRLFANVWDDWTLLTWGMLGAMPLLIRVAFASVPATAALPVVVGLTGILTVTAVTYLRSPDLLRQLTALLGGVLSTVVLVAVVSGLVRLNGDWTGLYGLTLGVIVVVAALFSPIFIGVLHRSLDAVRAG